MTIYNLDFIAPLNLITKAGDLTLGTYCFTALGNNKGETLAADAEITDLMFKIQLDMSKVEMSHKEATLLQESVFKSTLPGSVRMYVSRVLEGKVTEIDGKVIEIDGKVIEDAQVDPNMGIL